MTISIFLSASIPLIERHEQFWKTADNRAIRDAVKALTAEIIHNNGKLVFGGHPAITPLISYIFRQMQVSTRDHVTLYQSRLFVEDFPPENRDFPTYVITDKVGDGDQNDPDTRAKSLLHMRQTMFHEKNDFSHAVFVGGMEGIFEEYEMLEKLRPNVPKYPIASTGAAAALAYERYRVDQPELLTQLTYSTLFRRLFEKD